MRNKFVYSCSVKIHASGFDKLLESMLCPPAGCGSIFPAKSCQDASAGERSGGYVDEVELCRPICSTLGRTGKLACCSPWGRKELDTT